MLLPFVEALVPLRTRTTVPTTAAGNQSEAKLAALVARQVRLLENLSERPTMTHCTLRLVVVRALAMTGCADIPIDDTAPATPQTPNKATPPAAPRTVISLAVSGSLRFVGFTLSARMDGPRPTRD